MSHSSPPVPSSWTMYVLSNFTWFPFLSEVSWASLTKWLHVPKTGKVTTPDALSGRCFGSHLLVCIPRSRIATWAMSRLLCITALHHLLRRGQEVVSRTDVYIPHSTNVEICTQKGLTSIESSLLISNFLHLLSTPHDNYSLSSYSFVPPYAWHSVKHIVHIL